MELLNSISLRTEQIVVYGTNSLGAIIYDNLIQRGLDGRFAFFLDTYPSIKELHDEKVLSISDLKNPRDYIYILASYNNSQRLKHNLLAQNVPTDNIYSYLGLSSENFQNQSDIKRIAIFPAIEDSTELTNLVQYLKWYTTGISMDFSIEIATTLQHDLNHPIIHLKKPAEIEHNLTEYDNLFVMHEKDLNKVLNMHSIVFCLDPYIVSLFDLIFMERLLYVSLSKSEQEFFSQNSQKNFATLQQYIETKSNPEKSFFENSENQPTSHANRKEAFVFGTGPSVGAFFNKTNNLNRGTKFVCNAFLNSTGITNKIQPDVYAAVDSMFFTEEANAIFEHLAYELKDNKKYLVVSDCMVPFLTRRFKSLQDNIIGIKEMSIDVHFPTENDLSVSNEKRNIIRTTLIPVASSLCDTIYIIGCDGGLSHTHGQKSLETWQYNQELTNTEIVNMSDIRKKYLKQLNGTDYILKHNQLMEEVLQFGEQQGKTYYSLTDSAIPAFKSRLQSISIINENYYE